MYEYIIMRRADIFYISTHDYIHGIHDLYKKKGFPLQENLFIINILVFIMLFLQQELLQLQELQLQQPFPPPQELLLLPELLP